MSDIISLKNLLKCSVFFISLQASRKRAPPEIKSNLVYFEHFLEYSAINQNTIHSALVFKNHRNYGFQTRVLKVQKPKGVSHNWSYHYLNCFWHA